MSIIATITADLEKAVREKNDEVGVLRLIKNAVTLYAKDKRIPWEEVTDEQVVLVLRSEAKKRRESITAFTSGGRTDLVERESRELEVVDRYLPASLSEDEIRKIIQDSITEQQLVPPYQFGRLMGMVSKKIAGRADGLVVKRCVEEYIAGS